MDYKHIPGNLVPERITKFINSHIEINAKIGNADNSNIELNELIFKNLYNNIKKGNNIFNNIYYLGVFIRDHKYILDGVKVSKRFMNLIFDMMDDNYDVNERLSISLIYISISTFRHNPDLFDNENISNICFIIGDLLEKISAFNFEIFDILFYFILSKKNIYECFAQSQLVSYFSALLKNSNINLSYFLNMLCDVLLSIKEDDNEIEIRDPYIFYDSVFSIIVSELIFSPIEENRISSIILSEKMIDFVQVASINESLNFFIELLKTSSEPNQIELICGYWLKINEKFEIDEKINIHFITELLIIFSNFLEFRLFYYKNCSKLILYFSSFFSDVLGEYGIMNYIQGFDYERLNYMAIKICAKLYLALLVHSKNISYEILIDKELFIVILNIMFKPKYIEAVIGLIKTLGSIYPTDIINLSEIIIQTLSETNESLNIISDMSQYFDDLYETMEKK